MQELHNSVSAREFVWWYNGHPDYAHLPVDLTKVSQNIPVFYQYECPHVRKTITLSWYLRIVNYNFTPNCTSTNHILGPFIKSSLLTT